MEKEKGEGRIMVYDENIKRKSRHPRIMYWFWNEDTLKDDNHKKVLKTVADNSNFDTVGLSTQGPGLINFWDFSYKQIFAETVEYAHELGIKVLLQLWPKGFLNSSSTANVNEAAAVAVEHEGIVKKGQIIFRSKGKWTRNKGSMPSVKSELLCAYAFKKTDEGFYDEQTLVDVTEKAEILFEAPEELSILFDVHELEGYNIYALFAHYYRVADMFSDMAFNDYKEFMDFYQDVPFDGLVLDEFKNIPIQPSWEIKEPFRGRIYGKSFDKFFYEKNGTDIKRVMFDMRYCPEGKEKVRISAINSYFDTYRLSSSVMEKKIYEYAKQVFGENSFAGLHNTYHNELDCDEIWTTCCNWWELPRKYAQTDEDIAFPVRLGIACQCDENLIYDMFYKPEKEQFFEKCMKDAAFGGRIHYLATGSSYFGLDVGTPSFLAELKQYEDCMELLNMFDPDMPEMSLLVVFGFPALYNWYPDYSVRNTYDINGSLNILKRVEQLWKTGIINALSTDDAIVDGRIKLDENNQIDYCGNKFDGLLYLYPQYSKPETLTFLRDAIEKNGNIRIIGNVSRDFNGNIVNSDYLRAVTINDECDIQRELKLKINDIPNGCRLRDGSVVMSNYESLRDGKNIGVEFMLNEKQYKISYSGVFAMKTDCNGDVEKLVASKLEELKENNVDILPQSRGENVMYYKSENR